MRFDALCTRKKTFRAASTVFGDRLRLGLVFSVAQGLRSPPAFEVSRVGQWLTPDGTAVSTF